MGWKRTLRTGIAIGRRIDRAQKQKAKNLAQYYKQLQKSEDFKNANEAVTEYNDYILFITSIHKEANDSLDWQQIANETKPVPPILNNVNENKALTAIANHKPTIFSKLFGTEKSILRRLESELDKSKNDDKNEYNLLLKNFIEELEEWELNQKFSKGVFDKNKEVYREILEYLNPFSDIKAIGSGISAIIEPENIQIDININSKTIVPDFSLTQTASGKLSKKKLATTRFYELYQDYVCSCVLRVSREIFAILPVKYVYATAIGEVLNTSTGHLEQVPVLSVAFVKETVDKLDLNNIDPSDTMKNFIHNMQFKKSTGFSPVPKISLTSLK